ncbi:MAG TPA: hypothetical protein VF132_11270 [Rudaea sp.]
MAARTAQAPVTAADAIAFVAEYGLVCEAARCGAIPSLVDAIAGEQVRGNWWLHPHSKTIFSLTRAVRAAPDVLTCRLVDGKITFVHERLWPALVRLAERLPHASLARLDEEHTASGRHAVRSTAFPDWVPPPVHSAAARLGETEALAQLRALFENLRK